MNRYLKIYKRFLISSFVRELEFKVNFYARILENAMWSLFSIMLVLVIYRNTDSVAGWTSTDAFALIATHYLIGACSYLIFPSLSEIPQHVRMGTLDFIITRPIDSQFWVSLRRINFAEIGAVGAGIAMFIYAFSIIDPKPLPMDLVAYGLLVIAATVIFYSVQLMMMTTAIWFVRVDNLFVFYEAARDVARYPVDIYNPRVKFTLTYMIPVALLGSVPARALVGEPNWNMVWLGLLYAGIAFFLARKFWFFALRSYSSASS